MYMKRVFALPLASAPRAAQRGVTLLEVLVALLILLIGLLGLAGLLVTTQQGEMESYQRKQAMVLLQDMIDRMTGNPLAANCYAFTTNLTNGSPALGTGYGGTFVCGAGSASQQARGSADLQGWHDALLGTSEKSSANTSVGAVIDARGCVTNPAPGVYTVSVAWRGIGPTFAPGDAFTCGKNQYLVGGVAEERVRRVVSVTVRLADLKA